MGESKRKRREQASLASERDTCLYGRGQVLHIVEFADEGAIRLDAQIAADLIRMPNAMRPRGLAMAGKDVFERLSNAMMERTVEEGTNCGFDADGGFVRTLDGDPFDIEGFHEMRGMTSEVAFILGDERLSFTSSPAEGMRDAGGTVVPDIPSAMAGLARLDAGGWPIVHADAPVTVQFAALQRSLMALGAPREWNDEDKANAKAIISHGMQLGTVSDLAGMSGTPDAWIDQAVYAVSVPEGGDEAPPGLDEVVQVLLDGLDSADPGAPRWKFPGRFLALPTNWVSRDEPGAGLHWVEIEREFAKAFPGTALPPSGAEFLVVTAEEGRSEVNRAMRAATPVARKGRNVVVRDDVLGLDICVLGDVRDGLLVAWSPGDRARTGSDPLMSERLADALDADDPPELPNTPAFREGFEAIIDVGLLGFLPSPDLEPDYPSLVMAQAHRRGLAVPDLLASLASIVKEGYADLSFAGDGAATPDLPLPPDLPAPANDTGHAVVVVRGLTPDQSAKREAVVAHARSFGGRTDEMLVTMLKAVDRTDWSEVDLDRDTRLLRDAYASGIRLSDIAVAFNLIQYGVDP